MTLDVNTKLREWASDPRAYCRDLLKVQDPERGLVPFRLNEIQNIFYDIIDDIRKQGRLVRVVVLKARREGISTATAGRFFHGVATRPHRYAMMITHEPDASDTIFSMHKRFYMHLPEAMRPSTKANNVRKLEFNKPNGKGLDSAIRVATAGKEDVGSGQLVHYCHLCMDKDTKVIIEHGREKKIGDLGLGDRLLTHNGNMSSVVGIHKKHWTEMPSGKRAIVLHPWLGKPVKMSPEHKVFTSGGWIEAQDIEDSLYVGMPIRKITHGTKRLPVDNKPRHNGHGGGDKRRGPDSFEFNEETGFFVGYYLAEGCASNLTPNGYANITLAFGPGEDHYAERARAAVAPWLKAKVSKIFSREDSKTRVMNVQSISVVDFIVRNFGRKDSKHIPDWAWDCGEDFCRGLVAGYLSGDGSKTATTKQNYNLRTVYASSIRESLTYQIRDLVASLGYGWGAVDDVAAGVRYGRNCQRQWTVRFAGDGAGRLRELMGLENGGAGRNSARTQKYFLADDHVWIKIKSISEGECEEFVDIEVDHADHSFRTPHFAVSNSELSKWPAHTTDALLTSIMQCVPRDPSSEIIIESTAKGIGGEFYDRYKSARYRYTIYLDDTGTPKFRCDINQDADEANEWSAVFFPWFAFKQYSMKVPAGFKMTPAEEEMKKMFNLSTQQLAWRRWSLQNNCGGDESKQLQEYPHDDFSAWVSSGSPVFDVNKLLAAIHAAKPPTARYECQFGTGNFIADPAGAFQVWKEPIPARSYVVSADVAEGIEVATDQEGQEKHDSSVIDVVDQLSGEQVAHWRGKLAPDIFAQLMFHVCRRYNMAWAVPERNNHGNTVVLKLFDMGYKKLWVEKVPDPPNKPRKRYGFNMMSNKRHSGVKFQVMDNLAAEVRDGTLGVNCKETLQEMLSYKRDPDGGMGAESSMHDDRVVSIGIAKFVRTRLPMPSGVQRRPEDAWTMPAETNPAPSIKGWL